MTNLQATPLAEAPNEAPPVDNSLLHGAFTRLAQLQGVGLDPLQLASALKAFKHAPSNAEDLLLLGRLLAVEQCKLFDANSPADPTHLPLLAHSASHGWGLLIDQHANGSWVFSQTGQAPISLETAQITLIAHIQLRRIQQNGDSFRAALKDALNPYRKVLLESGLASVFINFLALGSSLFSMQVYDRVVPTRAEHTLLVLSLGVTLSILLELAMKFARSHLMDHAVGGVDSRLSRHIFSRLLALRIDQLPASVGSLASQLRGHEQVRSFYTASTLFNLVDLPMGLLFLCVIAAIGSPWLALIPLVFALICLGIGLFFRQRINQLAMQGAQATNRKTGLLVEVVEGAETIKAGNGAWKFLARWLDVTTQSIHNDLQVRHASETLTYLGAALQQISYALLVAAGAYIIIQGGMTTGALIACSILGGRVLGPLATVPGLLVQHAHAKAAMEGLEKIFTLKTDNHAVERPVTPARIYGHFILDQALFSYPDCPPAIKIEKLEIKAGERIGILGPIGSGKSTLLRLLAGLYHPQMGRVLLDGLDMTQIHQQVLNRQIGYLQQDTRLFQGTLRENLLIGLPDPDDTRLTQVLQQTGLAQLIARHPRGLDLPIHEGGRGLSGGQRQLLAFTRLILCQPDIFLLDEPTASLDDAQEKQCLQVLANNLSADKTLVVVTHKPSLLPLFNRLIIVSGNQIIIDGPRDAVIAKLQQNAQTPNKAPAPNAAPASGDNKPVAVKFV